MFSSNCIANDGAKHPKRQLIEKEMPNFLVGKGGYDELTRRRGERNENCTNSMQEGREDAPEQEDAQICSNNRNESPLCFTLTISSCR